MAAEEALSPEKYISLDRSQRAFSSGERNIILKVYGVLRVENPQMSKRDVAERVGVAGLGPAELPSNG